jgi:hypothetical protein
MQSLGHLLQACCIHASRCVGARCNRNSWRARRALGRQVRMECSAMLSGRAVEQEPLNMHTRKWIRAGGR